MHEKRRRPDDPRAWLDRARSNLIRAKREEHDPRVYLEDLCFDAQQAAEKALKALCIEHGIDFPYVHDLARLITLLEEETAVPEGVREAGRLTRFAILTRYPGLDDPVTPDEHERAVALAERAVAWVEAQLGDQNASDAPRSSNE